MKVSALLRAGHKVSEGANLVLLGQPSTQSRSAWTMVTTDMQSGVEACSGGHVHLVQAEIHASTVRHGVSQGQVNRSGRTTKGVLPPSPEVQQSGGELAASRTS